MEKETNKKKIAKSIKGFMKTTPLTKGKRFYNRKLAELVRGIRGRKADLKIGEITSVRSAAKTVIANKLAKAEIDKNIEKSFNKRYQEKRNIYNTKKRYLDDALDSDEISQKKYDREMDKIEFQAKKQQYIFGQKEYAQKDAELPKNPFWKHRKEDLKAFGQVAKNLGTKAVKGIKTVGKWVGNGVKTIGKGLLNGIKKVPQLPKASVKLAVKGAIRGKRTLDKGKHYVGTKLKPFMEKANSVVAEAKRETIEKDWEKAIEENKAFDERRKTPREALGMQKEEIDEKVAVEKVNEGEERQQEESVLGND